MLNIRQSALLIILVMVLCSCKKTIQDQKEKYVLGVMTSGRWFLEYYGEGTDDKTWLFKPYQFQFFEDSRIDAIAVDSTRTPGVWHGNQSTLTMTITFAPAAPVLNLLNHPWLFTRSNIGLVFAETTTASGKKTIRLRKKT